MGAQAEGIVQRLQDQLDRIDGLITVRSFEGRLTALVEDRTFIASVRAALLDLEVPAGILDVDSATDYLIPFPNDDERLMAWIERNTSRPDQANSGEAVGE